VLPPGDVLVGYFPDQLTAQQAEEARRVLLPPENDDDADDARAAAAAAAVGWAQHDVRVFGRVCPQPRLVSYWADHPGLAYTYSGLTLTPRCWNDEEEGEEVGRVLRELRAVAERVVLSPPQDANADDANARALLPPAPLSSSSFFNTCLLNLYRSGADSIGWHSDNERLFGEAPLIASVSLGKRRDFFLRRRQSSSSAIERPRYWCPLGGDGDVLVMAGRAQEEYLHCVPARASTDSSARGAAAAASAPLDARRVSLTFRRVVVGGR
jgi:alkylated DNA repair dioxygenase AlkB